jgi:Family of unknown function (DUF5994)
MADRPRMIPHGNGTAASTSPRAAGAPSAIPTGFPSARVIFDSALIRHGTTDGGWWPRSRNARTELPTLIAALDARPGVRVQRLTIHRDEWDEIPHQLTADGSHFVRVDWLTAIPRHTVSVTTADGREPIALLVVSPDTPAETAWAAMNMAGTNPGTPQAADILTADEVQSPCRSEKWAEGISNAGSHASAVHGSGEPGAPCAEG